MVAHTRTAQTISPGTSDLEVLDRTLGSQEPDKARSLLSDIISVVSLLEALQNKNVQCSSTFLVVCLEEKRLHCGKQET